MKVLLFTKWFVRITLGVATVVFILYIILLEIFVEDNENQSVANTEIQKNSKLYTVELPYNFDLQPIDLFWSQIEIENQQLTTNRLINNCGLTNIFHVWTNHHKGGSRAFHEIGKKIFWICSKFLFESQTKFNTSLFMNQIVTPSRTTKAIVKNAVLHHFEPNINNLNKNINTNSMLMDNNNISTINNDDKNSNITIVLFHFIRDPISVILSGYNYHRAIPVKEKWLKLPLTNSYLTKCLMNSTVSDTVRQNGNSDFVDIDINITKSMANAGLTFIYNNLTVEQGLYIEYKRYSCNQYYEYLTMFDEIVKFNKFGKKNNCQNMQDCNMILLDKLENVKMAFNIKYEYFFGFRSIDNKLLPINLSQFLRKQSDFDDSMLKLLKLMKIIPNNINMNDMDILWKQLKMFDINVNRNGSSGSHGKIGRQMALQDSGPKIPEHVLRRHTTAGKYNEMQQIQLLLARSKQVCFDLKEKTLSLQYNWLYPQFC